MIRKKIFSLLICMTMIFAMVGCSKKEQELPKEIGQEVYELTSKVANYAQQYLDAEIDAEEVKDKIARLNEQIEALDEEGMTFEEEMACSKANAIARQVEWIFIGEYTQEYRTTEIKEALEELNEYIKIEE